MSECRVSFEWIPFEYETGRRYAYGGPVPAKLNSRFAVPAVYRWVLFKNGQTEPYEIYFGETENLSSRLNGYIHPGPTQQTNRRLKSHFENEIREGARCELQLLKFNPFRVNELLISQSSLSQEPIRVMLEGFLRASHDSTRCALLNLKDNPIERRMRKAMKADAETH
jgi:hypothetical protein